jgi:hypothetical protein
VLHCADRCVLCQNCGPARLPKKGLGPILECTPESMECTPESILATPESMECTLESILATPEVLGVHRTALIGTPSTFLHRRKLAGVLLCTPMYSYVLQTSIRYPGSPRTSHVYTIMSGWCWERASSSFELEKGGRI